MGTLGRGAGPHLLGISFLQQAGPEFLVAFARTHKDAVSAYGRQAVVNYHFHPLAVLPELEERHVCLRSGGAGRSLCSPQPKSKDGQGCNMTSIV